MRIGSLFAGIGGLELGLERAGLGHTIWQVEIDEFCRSILAQHWPDADRSVCDVREATKTTLAPVDLICGGFPCQNISSAGSREGLAGERSGLWREYARVVRELQPAWVVVENVASGAKLWVDEIVRELGQLGYEALPIPLSAEDVGAPHRRARIFVVAANNNNRFKVRKLEQRMPARRTNRVRDQGQDVALVSRGERALGHADDDGKRAFTEHAEVARLSGGAADSPPWASAPEFRGVDDGFSDWVDSPAAQALGNAVVPQCAEVIGWVIRELEGI